MIGIIGLTPPLLTLARPKEYSAPEDLHRRLVELSEVGVKLVEHLAGIGGGGKP